MIFLIIMVIYQCSNKSVTVSRKLHVTEQDDRIEIVASNYGAFINKSTAKIRFTNKQGISYSSFPLSVQFKPNKAMSKTGTFTWHLDKKKVILEERENNVLTQQIKLEFRHNGFEIQFGIKIPDEHNVGIFCGKRAQVGFDQSSWQAFFSPEPDEYYKTPPMVDIRTVNDKQWFFSPAPLNISIETTAGWFSIGLAECGPFTRYSIIDSAVWLDIPWKKVPKPADDLFWISPFIFTFNESEWNAVRDYRTYLDEYNFLPRSESQSKPADWWRQPILSTRGEQIIQKVTQKNPGYTSAWVKEYITQQLNFFQGIPFTIIIEGQWQELFGDPKPSERFADMRELIDWCHGKGHKVVLWWKSWNAEANSLAQNMFVADGDLVDATHKDFETYIQHCCAMMLSAADTALNADGLKIADIFLVREPEKAAYYDSTKGIGLLEAYHYMQTIYNQAKSIKPDALIIGSAQAPQFVDVQDMVCINEDWDNKLRREKRARIISQALPEKLIVGDAADMSSSIARYHYVTSGIYAVPCLEYTTYFHDGPILGEDRELLLNLINQYQKKGRGKPLFIDYGWWQWKSNDRLVAESIAKGSAVIYYVSKNEGLLISAANSDIPFLLDGMRLIDVKTEKGDKVQWEKVGTDVYRVENSKKGAIYKLKFKRYR